MAGIPRRGEEDGGGVIPAVSSQKLREARSFVATPG